MNDTAEAGGIHEKRYFSHASRKKFGMIPSEYAASEKKSHLIQEDIIFPDSVQDSWISGGTSGKNSPLR